MENAIERRSDWMGLPVIATVARMLCRELTLQNEYLRLENRILKEKVSGRMHFTDEERRSLVHAALALGRSLMKDVVISIVKPETILAGQRRLERKKWDYSERRKRGPGRPRTRDDIDVSRHQELTHHWRSVLTHLRLVKSLRDCLIEPFRDLLQSRWVGQIPMPISPKSGSLLHADLQPTSRSSTATCAVWFGFFLPL